MEVYEFEELVTPAVMSRGLDDYHQFVTGAFILMFQLGYIIFEYGSVRKKNASTVLIKTFGIILFSCWATYSFGFAFAYGKTYVIGEKYYFTSFNMDDSTNEKNEIKWSLHFATASLTAQLAASGLQERSKILIAMVFSIVISLVVFPFVVGWTLGEGFMFKLGLVDATGCCAIHLVAGFCSMFAAVICKARLGRFNPLALKKIYSLKEKNEIVLQHIQKQWIQSQVTQISTEFEAEQTKSLEQQVNKIRKLIKRADSDNFYNQNDEVFTFVGTLIMWFTLCHLQSGFNLSVFNQRYQVEIGYVNCLVSGGCGGLSAVVLKRIIDLQYTNKTKDRRSNGQYKNLYDYSNQIFNPFSKLDIFVMGRGIIAGCVIVSAPGIYYKIWVSMILGCIGGIIYVGSSVILQKFKIDDPMHIFQTHGVPAVISLIFIVCFHQEVGIFFTDPNDIITQEKLQEIIQIFGANVLGCLLIICWCGLFTIPALLSLKMCLRAGRVSEIIGLDSTLKIIGRKDIENFVYFIITEYFPEDSGEYMRKKKKLIEDAKEGRKKGRQFLSKDELKKIRVLLYDEIRLAFTEADSQQDGVEQNGANEEQMKSLKTFNEQMMDVDQLELKNAKQQFKTQKFKKGTKDDFDKLGYSHVESHPTEERKDSDFERDPDQNFVNENQEKDLHLRKSPTNFMKSPSFLRGSNDYNDDDSESHEGELTQQSEPSVDIEEEVERRSLTQRNSTVPNNNSSGIQGFVSKVGNAIKQRVGLVNNLTLKNGIGDASEEQIENSRGGVRHEKKSSKDQSLMQEGPVKRFK